MREKLRGAHRLMRRQYGVASRQQLLELGMPATLIDSQLRVGRWEACAPGIYRVAGGAVPPGQHHMIAVLRCGPDARLTGAAVLALLGVEGFRIEDRAVVLAGRNRWLRTDTFTVHRVHPPDPVDCATVAGIPAVTPTRALLDLARNVRGKALRVAVDAVVRRGLTSPQRLLDRALAAGRSHGAAAIVEAVLADTSRHESEGERNLAALFFDTPVTLDYNVRLLPGIRVDAYWPEARLVLEYDGRARHTLPTDVEADRARDDRLRAAGYEVVRVRHEDLRDPEGLRSRILALGVARGVTLA